MRMVVKIVLALNPMSDLNLAVTSCRHCQHYQGEGRRGGHCQQLGAQVQGAWKSCSLAIPPFSPSWETPQPLVLVKPESILLDEVSAPDETLTLPEPLPILLSEHLVQRHNRDNAELVEL